jgi:transposase
MLEKGFPTIWVPSVQELDLRQLLKHRHTLVQMRTRIKNQLQHIALTLRAVGNLMRKGSC